MSYRIMFSHAIPLLRLISFSGRFFRPSFIFDYALNFIRIRVSKLKKNVGETKKFTVLTIKSKTLET